MSYGDGNETWGNQGTNDAGWYYSLGQMERKQAEMENAYQRKIRELQAELKKANNCAAAWKSSSELWKGTLFEFKDSYLPEIPDEKVFEISRRKEYELKAKNGV